MGIANAPKAVGLVLLFVGLVLMISGCDNPVGSDKDGGDGNGGDTETESALVVTYHANGGTAGTAPTDTTEYSSGSEVTVLDNTGDLVGTELGGDHSGSGIKQRFLGWNTDQSATTALYIAGDTFTITANTSLYAVYTTGDSAVRKIGPAGGLIFYDYGASAFWGRYLEAAPEDQSTGTSWSNVVDTEVGGTGTAIGIGSDNTDAIIDQSGHTASAAQICREYRAAEEGDWFLPSIDELNLMYSNLHLSDLGDFANEFYWASSETDDTRTQYQDFTNGNQGSGSKANNFLKVRAARAF